jgi:hypothetical protein
LDGAVFLNLQYPFTCLSHNKLFLKLMDNKNA